MSRIIVAIDVDKFDGEDVEGCYSVFTPIADANLGNVFFEAGYVGFDELAFEIKENVLNVLRAKGEPT
jgi:hypothetical protein